MLNINELANALKPVVLPGEFMKVFILKEGKEYNQGVAYLDDGTMVVVDNARRMISKNIDVVVTSVLQTTAGKMIFGRYIESGRGLARRQVPQAPPQAVARRPAGHAREREVIPPFHWWRTVFFLIPPIGVYTIVLGTMSMLSSFFDRTGDFGHRCARDVVVADPQDDRRPRPRHRRRAARSDAQLRLLPPTIRASTTSRSCSRRCRCSSASSRRSRWARFRFSAGTSGRTGHLLVNRSNPGADIVQKMRRLVSESPR